MGEVSLSAKCLSCKHKDLNMIPKLKNKKKVRCGRICLFCRYWENWHRRVPGACWIASLAEEVRPSPQKENPF